jgi:hypothetical protein
MLVNSEGKGGRIILKLIFKKWNGVVWTGVGLANDSNGWKALVDAVMNL